MRVVVFGATGNVGTSLLRALEPDTEVDEIVGVARRRPHGLASRASFVEADVERDDLASIVRGADAVVHLAWRIQPSRDQEALWRTNVAGSGRVFRAVADAGVPALVYASSVGAYAAGPKDRLVDESWPTTGIPASFYSRHKAEVERLLDRFEEERPDVRVVRLRPGLIFKREAAAGVRRLFLGPFLPPLVFRRVLVPVVPDHERLRFQGVHSLDAGEAYRLALHAGARGAFNIAAEPVIDGPRLAELAGARAVRVPAGLLRAAAEATWRLRLQPTPSGWVDLALGVPLLDVTRAQEQLGWSPRHPADDALRELLEGMRDTAGAPTPPLDPAGGGPARAGELATGVGARDDAG